MVPSVLTILPTYQCTAACKECCFECSPSVHGRIPLDRLLAYIDEACDTIPSLKLVVFSGGECFLLRKDLDVCVARAHDRGKLVRVVTNAYWARTMEAARTRLQALRDAGLDELNISTGDDHLAFVPFESVVNGLIAGAELGMVSLAAVEGFDNSRFKAEDAVNHPRIQEFWKNHRNARYLQVLRNIWMPFHTGRQLEHHEALRRTPERARSLGGCDNVLHNMVVTPDESLASCCGLTMEHIPEMKLGKLARESMAAMVQRGTNDFLKQWIWLDGPDVVLQFASSKDDRIKQPEANVHPCQACAQFYLDPRAREAVRAHWHEVRDDVLLRSQVKVKLMRPAADPPTQSRRGCSASSIRYGSS